MNIVVQIYENFFWWLIQSMIHIEKNDIRTNF